MKKILLILPVSFSMGLLCAQSVGIGTNAPLGTLDVLRGTAPNGTALFRGTTHASAFNFGTAEDTYIRGGKNGSNVILNDETLGRVGIGTNAPQGTLDVARGTGPNGTAQFRGTTHVSHFNYGTAEDTYIRGGKDGSNVIINDGALGNVGIGTASPQTQLHVNKTGEALRISGFNSSLSVYDNSGNGVGFILNNSGSIDLGTFVANTNGEVRLKTKGQSGLIVQSDDRVRVGAVPSESLVVNRLPKFTVVGPLAIKKDFGDQIGEWTMIYSPSVGGTDDNDLTFYFNGGPKAHVEDTDGDWIPFSDSRLKENFENYKSVLDGIKKIDVLTYHYKADKTGKRSFGLIAQNVQQYFPEIVSESGGADELLGIAYAKTGVLAIKGIQEQQVMIEDLENEIEGLKNEIGKLKKLILKKVL